MKSEKFRTERCENEKMIRIFIGPSFHQIINSLANWQISTLAHYHISTLSRQHIFHIAESSNCLIAG